MASSADLDLELELAGHCGPSAAEVAAEPAAARAAIAARAMWRAQLAAAGRVVARWEAAARSGAARAPGPATWAGEEWRDRRTGRAA